MTEITDKADLTIALPDVVERFVLHWGDLGGQWGVNRSVAQVQALLYLSERPLPADEIATMLGMARSNVSTSLRELLGWNLVHRVPVANDRRDHFMAETDLWEMAARIAAGRKEREVDPALKVLRACVADAQRDRAVGRVARQRLQDMLEFTETLETWYAQMFKVPRKTLSKLVRLGGRIVQFLPGRGDP